MDTVRMGLQDSLVGVGAKKPAKLPTEPAIGSMADSSDSERSPSIFDESMTGSLQRQSSSQILDFIRVPEVVRAVKNLIVKLDDYDESTFREEDLHSYLQYIADERLMHMPRKGSDWDRVLRTAQFFGLQIWSFGEKVGQFAPQSQEAAAAALTSCRVLLEVRYPLHQPPSAADFYRCRMMC